MAPRTRSIVRLFASAFALAAAGAGVLVARATTASAAQDQSPTSRDVAITARDFRFTPDRIEAAQDDLVRLTVRSEDVAYSFNIDEYRVSRRVPAGGSVVIEFRADRSGAFPFYSNLTSDTRHEQARGQLIVRAR
jgi:heme/copper-type cytochrome/quinol oxidase subunit 2